MTNQGPPKPTAQSLAALLAAVSDAHDDLFNAQRREAEARQEATAALNAANQAQREYDQALKAFKTQSPRDTDWFREAHGKRGVSE